MSTLLQTDHGRHGSPPGPTSGSAVSAGLGRLFRGSPHFRGKARLQQWLLRTSGTERASVFGYVMSLDLSDVIQRDIYAGLYEPYETTFLKSWLRPGMTVVDVGANVGYYTWMASSLVGPAGRAIAVEPGPYAFERLERVVADNAIRNVTLNRMALSDTSGTATLFVPRSSEGNYNPSLTPYLPNMLPVDVAVERLDDLLDRLRVERVDLLKVDVEGHEIGVFRGAAASFREHRIRAVLCEFNEEYTEGAGGSCRELEEWLFGHQFVTSRQFPSKWGSRVHNRLYALSN
jgi:FkbM family methyltransferase